MLAERDVSSLLKSFHRAVCLIQGYAAATLMNFFVCTKQKEEGGSLTQEACYRLQLCFCRETHSEIKPQTLSRTFKTANL